MNSPISLGFVFLAVSVYAVAIGRTHLGPVAYGLVGLLGVAGVVVMARLRAAYYLGLVAGGATAIVSLIDWSGVVSGRHLGLPFHPGIGAIAGLYLCFRIVLAQRMFGPRKPIGRDPESPLL